MRETPPTAPRLPFLSSPGSPGGFLASDFYDPNAEERFSVVLTWVLAHVRDRERAGGMQSPAPITTRLYQNVGAMDLAFHQCLKIATTPFPFPTAQLTALVLVLYSVALPLLVAAWVNSTALAAAITYISCLMYWSVNEIARDIEDPFLYDPNHLPLTRAQYRMNERMLQIFKAVERALPTRTRPSDDPVPSAVRVDVELSQTYQYRVPPAFSARFADSFNMRSQPGSSARISRVSRVSVVSADAPSPAPAPNRGPSLAARPPDPDAAA